MNYVLVVLLFVLPVVVANADPKAITIDGCVKVETVWGKMDGRYTMTVKCTGEAFDPKVRAEFDAKSLAIPNSMLCGGSDSRGNKLVNLPCGSGE
jgi:hypothetical protein